MRILLGLMAVVLMAGSSCSTVNSVATAQTPQQKAYAVYGTFVVFEEQAATVVALADVPQSAKDAIKAADAKAKPVADNLLAATKVVIQATNDVSAGKTTNDKLAIAVTSLSGWVDQATPLVNNLIAAVNGAKKP